MPRPPNSERTVENRLRRVAARRGYIILKARSRDLLAVDYQRFAVAVADGPGEPLIVAGLGPDGRFAMTRAELDAALDTFTPERRAGLIAAAKRGNRAAHNRKDDR